MHLTLAFMAVLLAQGQSSPAAPALSEAVAVQVMLDRAGYSPGVIDGHMGRNTQRALDQYRAQRRDVAPPRDPLLRYMITPADVSGPYTPEIPDDLEQQ